MSVDLFDMFNSIYKNSAEKVGFEVNDREEFQSVLNTLKENGMPTENFLENLKTLAMRKVSFDDPYTQASYVPLHNRLDYSNENKIKHELFHMAASKKGATSGVCYIEENGTRVGEALNEGITEYFCKKNDPNYQIEYPFEEMVSETLSFIYGGSSIFEHHFKHNPIYFLRSLGDMRKGKELMVQLDKFRTHYYKVQLKANSGTVDKEDFDTVKFYFEQVLLLLTELYFKTGRKDKKEFQEFVAKELEKTEMDEVRFVVTGFGTKEMLDDKFKGKLF